MVQDYAKYKVIDPNVWSILYNRQLMIIGDVAYENFSKGIEQLGFCDKRIPDFATTNVNLENITGWQIYAVPGLIDNRHFFEKMFLRQFGATTWIRKMEELDYLEEPDMFHDIFGHVPLLADPLICDYLHGLAKIAVKFIDRQEVIEALARLYWYTIEFGLVKQNDQLKIYGAGILSSIGETEYCLSDKAEKAPFDLETIINTPYIKDSFQQKYFVLDSMQQLEDINNQITCYFN